MQCLMKMSHFYAYSAFHYCTNINDFLNFKLVVHALHSNFAMDSLEIWNIMLIFRIKTGRGGGGGVM